MRVVMIIGTVAGDVDLMKEIGIEAEITKNFPRTSRKTQISKLQRCKNFKCTFI